MQRHVLVLAILLVLVVVVHAHLEQLDWGPTDAVLPQLLQLETLTVLSPDVHEQRVVRDAEYPRRLAGGHLLVPHVLQGFRQFGIGPGPGWSSTGRRVLSLGSIHCK